MVSIFVTINMEQSKYNLMVCNYVFTQRYTYLINPFTLLGSVLCLEQGVFESDYSLYIYGTCIVGTEMQSWGKRKM